jgi:hypothetical protein
LNRFFSLELIQLTTFCDTAALALSLTSSPTLWFYIPQQSRPDTVGQLTVLDESEQPIATEQVTLSTEAGVVGVALSQPLRPDRPYHWVFSILINPRRPSQNPTVEGVIQWTEPNTAIANQLNQARSPLEKVAIYRQHQIWQDALTELIALRQNQPDDANVNEIWNDLLEEQGLEAIANAPISDCCIAPR